MKVSFATNLYDKDGDCYEKCILLFIGEDETIIKFKDLVQLKDFVREIQGCIIPEIIESCSDEIDEEDLVEFE